MCAAALLAACGDGGPGQDEPDARIDIDGGGGGNASLSFEFTTAPLAPTTVGTVEIDELRVWLRDVRAIGDSAPGDSRTSIAQLQLEWREGQAPAPLSFPAAPPGVYARLDARLGQAGGEEHAWELRGRVRRTDGVFVLELEDEALAAVSVPLDALVLGTTPRVATIELSLAFLAAVDWQSLPVDGDKIVLETGAPQLAAITAALAASFRLAAVR